MRLPFDNLACAEPEEDHLLAEIIALALRAVSTLHPELKYTPSEREAPPQILPLKPQLSTNLALPVLNVDESSITGAIDLLRGYLNVLGIKDEELSKRIIASCTDQFTVGTVDGARKHRLPERSGPFEKLQWIHAFPAPFHTTVGCYFISVSAPLLCSDL